MRIVHISLKAHKQIAKLNRQDIATIYTALEALEHWPAVSGVKALAHMHGYRLRIGAYRALFDVTSDAISVAEVRRRDERTY